MTYDSQITTVSNIAPYVTSMCGHTFHPHPTHDTSTWYDTSIIIKYYEGISMKIIIKLITKERLKDLS